MDRISDPRGLLLGICPLKECEVERTEYATLEVTAQLAGFAVGAASSAFGALSVAKYIVTAFASASLKPNAGILVSGFMLWGFFTHR